MHDGCRYGKHTNDKEVSVMPSVEMVERERVAYVKDMRDYLKNLKRMEASKAKEVSRASLISCEILREDGEFTEFYQRVAITVHKKRKNSV